ncbi:hypothetical protein [Brevundimonas sp.]|uniref:hypothetical protein n=1 Tax=Brevundimonas sp. TaxID=1871086 RepID=UPI0028A95584|nr:hypothetical protein [Brevundimonas sp.]
MTPPDDFNEVRGYSFPDAASALAFSELTADFTEADWTEFYGDVRDYKQGSVSADDWIERVHERYGIDGAYAEHLLWPL